VRVCVCVCVCVCVFVFVCVCVAALLLGLFRRLFVPKAFLMLGIANNDISLLSLYSYGERLQCLAFHDF